MPHKHNADRRHHIEVIDDELRSRTDQRRATEVDVAVHALNRMLDLGRAISACFA